MQKLRDIIKCLNFKLQAKWGRRISSYYRKPQLAKMQEQLTMGAQLQMIHLQHILYT